MIKTKLFAILITIALAWSTLSGCNDSSASTIQVIKKHLNELIKNVDFPNNWINSLSPDGKFLAIDEAAIDKPLKVISTISGEEIPINNLNPSFGKGMSVGAWSPDSTKIAAFGTDNPGICPYDRVVIFHLEKEGFLEGYVFSFPQIDQEHCLGVSWSPDSTKLVIKNQTDEIFVIDQLGDLIRTIAVDRQSRNYLLWTSKGIFLNTITYHKGNKTYSSEISIINPLTFEKATVLSEREKVIGLHAISPDGKRLLLGVGAKESEEKLIQHFWIFDLPSRKTIKKLDVQGDYNFNVYNTIETLPWVSYQFVYQDDSHYRQLFLFDWNELKFKDYGRITRLIGWRSPFKGFLVVNGDEGNYQVDVIVP